MCFRLFALILLYFCCITSFQLRLPFLWLFFTYYVKHLETLLYSNVCNINNYHHHHHHYYYLWQYSWLCISTEKMIWLCLQEWHIQLAAGSPYCGFTSFPLSYPFPVVPCVHFHIFCRRSRLQIQYILATHKYYIKWFQIPPEVRNGNSFLLSLLSFIPSDI